MSVIIVEHSVKLQRRTQHSAENFHSKYLFAHSPITWRRTGWFQVRWVPEGCGSLVYCVSRQWQGYRE